MAQTSRRHRCGLTLIEAMIALAVLEMAVLAVTHAIAAGQDHVQQSENALVAVDIAEDLMEEILARPYGDPDGPSGLGPEAGETTRRDFDNADDFYGYREWAGSLVDAVGRRYGDAAQAYTRMAWVWPYRQPVAGLGRSVTGLLAVVLVQDARGGQWMLVQFIPERAS